MLMEDIHVSNIRKLDGRLLLVLRTLLECRNASRTAERLNLSQSAVSHSLARLREVFGDELFLRRSHGLEPTTRALTLGPRVERVVAMLGEMTGEPRDFDPRSSDRRFELIAPEFVVALAGGRLLELFANLAPGVSFGFRQVGGELVWDLLRRGEVDLAVGRFDSLPSTDFATTLVYEDRYCVVARQGHPHPGYSITYDEYERLGHVFAYSSSELAPWEAHVDYSGLRSDALVPHWLTALSMVAASGSIATCPRRLAERLAGPFGLRLLEAPFLSTEIRVYAARRRHYEDAGINWSRERLLESLV